VPPVPEVRTEVAMNRTLAIFCRLCLLLYAVLIIGVCAAMGITGAVMFPQLLVVMAVIAVYFGGRRLPSLWSHGTARWGTVADCRGMLETNGLPLGTLPRPTWREGFKALFTTADPEAACRVTHASNR
jgi:hypothetical protein